jgi:hypothetical protein
MIIDSWRNLLEPIREVAAAWKDLSEPARHQTQD